MKVRSYKELDVWKKGVEIVDRVYDLTDKFPPQERYGLTSQMRKSAVSIPSNVAEGFSRGHTAEYKQFLYISFGSCAELNTQSIIACRRKYISEAEALELENELEYESRMLMNLIKSLKRNAKP